MKQKILISKQNSLIGKLISSPYQKRLSDEDIQRIIGDLVVSQNNLSRKAFVEKKEVNIQSKSKELSLVLKKVFYASIISQILETYLYGINVFEVNWEFSNGLYIPKLIGRDFREFKFNEQGKLVFLGNGWEEDIPPFKVVYGIYNQSFYAPYGESALKKLYFSVNIKNAGLDFWIQFLERFGSPWAVGKTDEDAQGLAYEVSKMLSGSTAVIDKEEELELIYPNTNTSAFKEIAEYCDSQINRFMLGGNLTGEVKGGSLAAAQVHNSIREDIALSDERILIYVANKVISYFKELNGIKEEITFTLFDEDDPRIELAKRDKTIYEMGYQPTKEYIQKTYNIEVTPIETPPIKNFLNKSLIPFKKDLKNDNNLTPNIPLDNLDKGFKDFKIDSAFGIDEFLKDASSFEEVEKKIQNTLRGDALTLAEEELAKLIANASILGEWSVFDEL